MGKKTWTLFTLGLDAGTLSLRPNDKHLVRIAKEIPITIFDQFIIHLGLTREKWEEIEYQFLAKEGVLGSKLMAMNELQNIKEIEDQPVIFKDLSDALIEIDRPHSLCQVSVHLFTSNFYFIEGFIIVT